MILRAVSSCQYRMWYLLGMEASGKFMIRMPSDLHAQLTARAGEQGVSLNQLVVTLLAGGIGFKLDH
jgi:hypothetical protein